MDPRPRRAADTNRFWGRWDSTPHCDTHLDLGCGQHPNPGTLRSAADVFLCWCPSISPGPGGYGTGPGTPPGSPEGLGSIRGGHSWDPGAPCSAGSPRRAGPAPPRTDTEPQDSQESPGRESRVGVRGHLENRALAGRCESGITGGAELEHQALVRAHRTGVPEGWRRCPADTDRDAGRG